MEWPRLVGAERRKPPSGTWRDWKQHIADECGSRCVYCAIDEGRFGGLRNFHVEHFRPKSRFPRFENEIRNLYLACAVCNVLKCDDWPGDPKADHTTPAYPDPAQSDYNDLFSINLSTFEVSSVTVAGQYVTERLMLNRAQLVLQRRLHAGLLRLGIFETWCQSIPSGVRRRDLRAVVKVLSKVGSIKAQIITARPYQDKDTKRPARAKPTRVRSR